MDLSSFRLGDGERTVTDRPVEVTSPQHQAGTGREPHVGGVSVVGVACGSRHSEAYGLGNNVYAQLSYDFKRPDYKENQVQPPS